MRRLTMFGHPAMAVHIVGALVVMMSLFFWFNQWHDVPTTPQEDTGLMPVATDTTSQAIAGWLGPGDIRLDIDVLGVLQQKDRAVALLRVNDGQPEVYMQGELLMKGVRLKSISAEGIVLQRSGRLVHVQAPKPAYLSE